MTTIMPAVVIRAYRGAVEGAPRLRALIDGVGFTEIVSATITRDLREIAGEFQMVIVERAAAAAATLNSHDRPPFHQRVTCGNEVILQLDGETVLKGWIDECRLEIDGRELRATISGRDRTGDLVDCAAAPNGPAEFNGVDLLAVALQICKPFGIPVRSETDVGAPFVRLAVHPHETAMAFLEKASRQRAVLLVSDGVGGLLLTNSGNAAAPAPLRVGDNLRSSEVARSWRGRFSDVFVKGQSEHAASSRTGPAPQGHFTIPGLPGDFATHQATEQAGILMTGHAYDSEITRWRPIVRLTRSQSGMSTTQEQAAWYVRVARGEAEQARYTVLGWRAGEDNDLWRVNEVAPVYDPYAGYDTTMLIAGVTYQFDGSGQSTTLRVVGRTAYDRIDEADRRRRPRPRRHHDGHLDDGEREFRDP